MRSKSMRSRVKDHYGNKFKSNDEMALAYGLNPSSFSKLTAQFDSTEDALLVSDRTIYNREDTVWNGVIIINVYDHEHILVSFDNDMKMVTKEELQRMCLGRYRASGTR